MENLKPMKLQKHDTHVMKQYRKLGDIANEAFFRGDPNDPAINEFSEFCLDHDKEIKEYFEINREAIRNNIQYNLQRVREAGLL